MNKESYNKLLIILVVFLNFLMLNLCLGSNLYYDAQVHESCNSNVLTVKETKKIVEKVAAKYWKAYTNNQYLAMVYYQEKIKDNGEYVGYMDAFGTMLYKGWEQWQFQEMHSTPDHAAILYKNIRKSKYWSNKDRLGCYKIKRGSRKGVFLRTTITGELFWVEKYLCGYLGPLSPEKLEDFEYTIDQNTYLNNSPSFFVYFKSKKPIPIPHDKPDREGHFLSTEGKIKVNKGNLFPVSITTKKLKFRFPSDGYYPYLVRRSPNYENNCIIDFFRVDNKLYVQRIAYNSEYGNGIITDVKLVLQRLISSREINPEQKEILINNIGLICSHTTLPIIQYDPEKWKSLEIKKDEDWEKIRDNLSNNNMPLEKQFIESNGHPFGYFEESQDYVNDYNKVYQRIKSLKAKIGLL